VRLGLAPLQQLVLSINKRDEHSLQAIQLDVVPSELRPVLEAINGLINRLQSALTREKQLTADTAHELRTPLSVVLIHAQNAINNNSETQRNSALNELEKGVKRVARLLEQLLTLSKINPEMIPKTELNLHHLTQTVMAEVAVKVMAKNQELILDCDPEIQNKMLLGSDFLLEILIRNLVDNASQYTPEEGQIKLTINKLDSGLQLVVEDSGIGIDSKLYSRLTQRFYRQHQQHGKGAGLGLTLVSDIVEFHQGKLTFDSSDLGGLLVKVNLPA
jgi:two-component system sensor histidine kinase QseC